MGQQSRLPPGTHDGAKPVGSWWGWVPSCRRHWVCAQAAAPSPSDAFPAMVWSGFQALLRSSEEGVVAGQDPCSAFLSSPTRGKRRLLPAQTCCREDIFELCRNLEPTHNFWFLR